jgi:hypothetical protein
MMSTLVVMAMVQSIPPGSGFAFLIHATRKDLMAVTLATYNWPVATELHVYTARACGRQREDGLCEGWIEFETRESGEVLRSQRETTQPNLTDLRYWATGLTPVYLEGVLARILDTRTPRTDAVPPPAYDGPAPSAPPALAVAPLSDAVLDPFSVYSKSPDLLARELRALRGWQLKRIVRAYALADARTDLELLTESELIGLILRSVSTGV